MIRVVRMVQLIQPVSCGSVGSFSLCMQSVVSLSLTSTTQDQELGTLVDCWDILPSLYIRYARTL